MADDTIISTSNRFRISGELSYPIGAEAISEALRGVPQFDALSICFYHGDGPSPKSFREAVARGEFLQVFSANYQIEKGWFEEKWGLWVLPVLREDKRAVREALLAVGLPRVRAWLAEPRGEMWRHGRKSIAVSFRPSTGDLRVSKNE